MNWVRLKMSVNHKQSRSARKGDLRHFYVSGVVATKTDRIKRSTGAGTMLEPFSLCTVRSVPDKVAYRTTCTRWDMPLFIRPSDNGLHRIKE